MIEEWKAIIGYEGKYEVSNFGRVRSLITNIIMRQQDHWKGHKIIFFGWGKFKKKYFVHRLVAIAFIPNPRNVEMVNHKNMDKKNNHIDNLEWMTCSENTQHYYDNRVYKAGEVF